MTKRLLQEAYEVLVNALESGAELGECVTIIEEELAKRELPGDVRRASRQVQVAPALENHLFRARLASYYLYGFPRQRLNTFC